MSKIQISLRLDESLLQDLDTVAAERRRDRSDLIRIYLDEGVAYDLALKKGGYAKAAAKVNLKKARPQAKSRKKKTPGAAKPRRSNRRNGGA